MFRQLLSGDHQLSEVDFTRTVSNYRGKVGQRVKIDTEDMMCNILGERWQYKEPGAENKGPLATTGKEGAPHFPSTCLTSASVVYSRMLQTE